MTRTLTLNATVQLDGGTLNVNVHRIDLDEPRPAALDLLAQLLGFDRIDHPATAGPQQVTDLAGTAVRAPVVQVQPAVVSDEDREYLRSPERLKNQTPAKKAAAKKPAVKGPVRRKDTVPYEKRRPGPKSSHDQAVLDHLTDGPWTGSWASLLNDLGIAKGGHHGIMRRLVERGLVVAEGGTIRLAEHPPASTPPPPPAPAPERERLAPVPDIEPEARRRHDLATEAAAYNAAKARMADR